jgi:hypothetical protein
VKPELELVQRALDEAVAMANSGIRDAVR